MLSKLVKIISFFIFAKRNQALLIAILLYCHIASPVFASQNSFVTVVNPVRGEEFWSLEFQKPLEAVVNQYELVKKNDLAATWLLRFDAIENQKIASFFQGVDKDQELGIFLEIVPSLAKNAGVSYQEKGIFWHDANRVFLSGYKPEDRKKLIDIVFEEFLTTFGFYPQSVGAWHIDAYSASYMREKYGITSILICADQFSTDNYQIWGQPWGVPYYPAKLNIQIPAQDLESKLDLVVSQWAARDPERGYGGSGAESTFSVQANDYLKHNLDTSYFRQLVEIYTDTTVNPFGQITVGLENDYDWEEYGKEYKRQIEVLAEMKQKGKIEVLTMADFAFWYKNHFPKISPSLTINARNASWVNTPFYRVGLIWKNGQEFIRDLRIYNDEWPEPFLLTPNPWLDLNLSVPAKIDTVRFPEKLVAYQSEMTQEKLKLPFLFSKIPALFLCFFVSLFLIFVFLKNKWLGILVFFGTLSQSLTMIKSGLLYPFGMGFWGPNGHDGTWHLALINQISQGNFSHPTFFQFNILNYHLGFDFLTALINKISGISVITLYFQILPPVLSFLAGILAYLVVKKWTRLELGSLLAVFFVYFGGSFGWLVTWFRERAIGGESSFWANQSISFLINPPYALSIVVLLCGFYLFLEYLEKPTRKLLLVLSLLFGLLIQIKVYAGVIVLGSLGFLGVIGVIRERKLGVLWLFLGSLAMALVVFLPLNFKAGSLLVFSPLWFPHTMLAFRDRIGWVRLENARQAYLATGQWLKWLLAEGLAAGIFILGNLGTRILGLGWLVSRFRGDRSNEGNRGSFEVFLGLALLISLILTLTLIQKGNPWNTIQFFYYFQFFMGILAGIYLATILSFFRNKLVKLILLIILVLLTVPTAIGTLTLHYLPGRPPARVSFEELEALGFLRKQASGAVLTYPYDPTWGEKFVEPRPLYAYETTAYVSAFSGKQTFLEDEMNLEISGYDWRPRREQEIRFFATDNKEWAKKFLQDNRIKYIYLVKGQKMNLGEADLGAKKIFENGEVRVFAIE